MSDALRKEAGELLKLKANKKLVQQYVNDRSGNVTTLKDLSNLMIGAKENSRNDLAAFVDRLKSKYGWLVIYCLVNWFQWCNAFTKNVTWRVFCCVVCVDLSLPEIIVDLVDQLLQ